jgi:hypothetical protein
MARIAGRYADGLNLQWHDRARFPELLAALDEGLGQAGRSRAGFDLSLHPGWRDLGGDAPQALAGWQAMGFTRVLVYVGSPFPLREIEQLGGKG